MQTISAEVKCCQGLSDPASDHSDRLRSVGLSFHDASLDLRSKANLTKEKATELIELLHRSGCSEALALSTCNRTEVYGSADVDTLVQSLCETTQTSEAELRPFIKTNGGRCVGCHLFKVAAGLDSAVLGESEIVAQIKDAWRIAESAGTIGPRLRTLLPRALEVSKRVRSETTLCRGVTSISALAVADAEILLGGLEGRSVAVVGAGQIAERLVRELHVKRPARFVVLNRSIDRACELAQRFGGVGAGLGDLNNECAMTDVIFTAVASPNPILFGRNLAAGQHVFDLGLPPNVDRAGMPPSILYRDLDAIVADSEANAAQRRAAVPQALAIIVEEVERFESELATRSASPTIRAITDRSDVIREENLRWALERLPDLDERQRKVVADLSRRIVKGMLEAPVESLKLNPDPASRALAERLFGLEQSAS